MIARTTSKKKAAPAASIGPLIKLDGNDKPLPLSAKKWDWVYDQRSTLIWPTELIDGKFDFAGAQAASTQYHAQARGAEVQEIVAVLDYSKHDPCVDTRFFRWKPIWVWTATKCTLPPAGYAFVVSLSYGSASILAQRFHYGALACRPGQSFRL